MKSVLSCFSVVVASAIPCLSQGGSSALQFDGSSLILNDSVWSDGQAPPAARLDGVSNTFTMELWVDPTAAIGLDIEATSGISGVYAGAGFAVWPTHVIGGSWGAGAGISVGTNGVVVYEHSDSYLPALLAWQGTISGCTHIAVVYQNKQPRLYVNGELVRTGLTSTRSSVHPSIDRFGGGAYGYYTGTLDEIRVWSVALGEDDIQARMNTPLTGDESGLVFYLPLDEGSGAQAGDASGNGSTYAMGDGVEWATGCVASNQSPLADAGDDQSTECESPEGTEVTLDGAGSSDPDGDDLEFEWRDADDSVVGTSATLSVTLPGHGSSTYSLIVTDPSGASDTDQVTITVTDTTPPSISVTVSPALLWLPLHWMRQITACVRVSDNCSQVDWELASITSDEPDDAPGWWDGCTSNDIQGAATGTPDTLFSLRAERALNGNGRVYTIIYTATDESGNCARDTATVVVPLFWWCGKQNVDQAELPAGTGLRSAVAPNPTTGAATISFDLATGGPVTARLYTSDGRQVACLLNRILDEGRHDIQWAGTDANGDLCANGIYIYIIESKGAIESGRVVVRR